MVAAGAGGGGSKRGNITAAIYKEHAHKFLAKKPQRSGDVMSTTVTPEQHEAHMRSQTRRPMGSLVTQ